MAHCMNCGNEIPEGTKFCPECGAKVPVKEMTSMDTTTYAEGQNQQNQDLTQGFFEQNISNPNSMSQANQAFEPVKTGSGIKRYAKFFGIGLFVAALLSFGVHMPFISIVLSGLIIGVAVFCLSRKYQLKGFTIAALVLSSLCLLSGVGNAGKYGLFQNHNYGTAREADAAETEVKNKNLKTGQTKNVKVTEKAVSKKTTETAQPTETPAGEKTQREQASDYNEATNKEYRCAGYVVHYPSTWAEGDSEGDFYAERGGGACGYFSITSQDGSYTTKAQLEKSIARYLNGVKKGFQDFTSSEISYCNHDTTGLPCAIVGITGKMNGIGMNGIIMFMIDENNKKVLTVAYYESENTEVSHMNDVQKTMACITKDESAESAQGGTSAATSGIRPEIKEAIDNYESFMDKYVEFMESYDSSDATMLMEYADILAEYSEFSKSWEEIKEEDLTDEELDYYLEVSSRVSEKLLKVSQK